MDENHHEPPRLPPDSDEDRGITHCVTFINRWGQRMHAPDYGYESWPIGKRGKQRR